MSVAGETLLGLLTGTVGLVCVSAVGYLDVLLWAAVRRKAPAGAPTPHPPPSQAKEGEQGSPTPLPVDGRVLQLSISVSFACEGGGWGVGALRFALIVPAHNEELVLEATLNSLRALQYPANQVEVLVIADNCTDSTAAIARAAGGVTVLERTNARERGKGYALAEAMRHLLGRTEPADVFVIVDADTWVAPDFLARMAAHLSAEGQPLGNRAIQGRYGVLNADESWRAALMAGAFDLVNHVKPLGRDQLGLSVGLKGNGMAFTRSVLEAVPFSGRSITEDLDFGLDLLRHMNLRVEYAPDALVRAQMPTNAKQAESQRQRWEGGRAAIVRSHALPLLSEGLQKRDPRFVDAAVDLLVPPLAEMAALLALWTALTVVGAYFGLLHYLPIWFGALALTIAGFVAYVLGGFRVAGAPRAAYRALLQAPGYAVWKLALLLLRPLRKRKRETASPSGNGDAEWVRTERAPIRPAQTVGSGSSAEEGRS